MLQKLPQKKYNVGYYNTKEDNLVKSRHSGLSGIGCFCNALGKKDSGQARIGSRVGAPRRRVDPTSLRVDPTGMTVLRYYRTIYEYTKDKILGNL